MGFRGCATLAGLVCAAALSGCPQTPAPSPPTPPIFPSTPEPVVSTPTPAPTPPPTPYVPNKRLEVGKIFNGLQLRATLETERGTMASADREDPAAYSLELKLNVKVPQPHCDLAALTRLNAELPTVLPGLAGLLESAKISPIFDDLYRLKVAAVQQNLLRLDNVLSRHNFFDCETVLELQHPGSKRRALLLQADMDTDTDGSDPDRVPEVDGSSATFQPFTSYKWARKGSAPSSFIPPREAKLRQYAQELGAGAVGARQQELKEAQSRLKTEIADLKKYAYLVASVDPYVVMPGAMYAARNRSQFVPGVGDLCVVIYGQTLYPAVVGDVGPMNVVGEGSLRLCQQINAKSNSANRPVNDLKVTYLLFPGTAEKPLAAPNPEKWRARCESLLNEIGGFGGELYAWEDLLKPKATPAPLATPAGTPSPTTSLPLPPLPPGSGPALPNGSPTPPPPPPPGALPTPSPVSSPAASKARSTPAPALATPPPAAPSGSLPPLPP